MISAGVLFHLDVYFFLFGPLFLWGYGIEKSLIGGGVAFDPVR